MDTNWLRSEPQEGDEAEWLKRRSQQNRKLKTPRHPGEGRGLALAIRNLRNDEIPDFAGMTKWDKVAPCASPASTSSLTAAT
jgi:hypothetical protein